MNVLTLTDFKLPLTLDNKQLSILINSPPKVFTLGNPKKSISNNPSAPMKRLFVNPYTGQGFLRIQITPTTDRETDIIDTSGLPIGFIRADAYLEDGCRCWMQNNVIGCENATVDKTYLFIV